MTLSNINKEKPSWHLYILNCHDGSFYTGITNNLERRLEQHNAGIASKYTRARLPVSVIYTEQCEGRSDASKREIAVKKLTRKAKENLVSSHKTKK